jgi:hypothetical protein
MKTKTKRRVHGGKRHNKTKKGSGFKDIFNTITGMSSFKPYKGESYTTYTNKELVNRFKQRQILAKPDDDNFHENLQSELESRKAFVGHPEDNDYKLEERPSMGAGRRSRRHYKRRSYRKRR